MKYKTRMIPGTQSNREIRDWVALASGVDPEKVGAFVVVVLQHNPESKTGHSVIVTSNLSPKTDQIRRLLRLGREAVISHERAHREAKAHKRYVDHAYHWIRDTVLSRNRERNSGGKSN